MFNLNRQVEVKDTSDSDFGYRTTNVANAYIRECENRINGYKELAVSVHNAKLETISMRTSTHKVEGKKFKVKRISFIDSDGVRQVIQIFGEHY